MKRRFSSDKSMILGTPIWRECPTSSQALTQLEISSLEQMVQELPPPLFHGEPPVRQRSPVCLPNAFHKDMVGDRAARHRPTAGAERRRPMQPGRPFPYAPPSWREDCNPLLQTSPDQLVRTVAACSPGFLRQPQEAVFYQLEQSQDVTSTGYARSTARQRLLVG